MCLIMMFMPTLVVTTLSSGCRKCGTMKKSGKLSCCGRGGSWFGDCGSARNANFGHTWYEGIRSCEARPLDETAVVQQLNASQMYTASDDDTSMNFAGSTSIILKSTTPPSAIKEIIPHLANVRIVNSLRRDSADKSAMTPSHSSANVSITAQKCGCSFFVVNQIFMAFIIVWW